MRAFFGGSNNSVDGATGQVVVARLQYLGVL